MERLELEALLDSKLEPLYRTVQKLEEQQTKIFDILLIQSKHETRLDNFQTGLEESKAINTREHDEMFKRLRDVEKASAHISEDKEQNEYAHRELVKRDKELVEQVSSLKESTGDKMWDVVKMFLVALLAGVIGRYAKG